MNGAYEDLQIIGFSEIDVWKKYCNQPAGARIGIDPGFYEVKDPSILFQMRYLDPESDIWAQNGVLFKSLPPLTHVSR